ncbi:MAG: hypothetical protein F8N37_22680 [Telmatospirillum sp.]|nr:hypothetical protein [Telmatospirillum sp.]
MATRPGINFLPGANVTLSIRDNPQASAVDVAISATGGGGSGGPGTGVPRTPPDPAAFAWANQGAAAVTFDGVRSIITIPPENGTQVRCLLQPLSGPAWTAVLSIDPGAPFVGSYILPGLVLFNQGTGQYCIVGGVRNSSSIVPTAYYGSSLSKYSSNLSSNTSTPIFGPFWSMVKYDGKNIAISISNTGFVWSTFYTGDLSVVGGAITHVGFGISSDGHPSNPLAAVFDSFSVSYP